LPKLTAWFDRTNRSRELLRGPLRPDLALLELLVAWAALGQSPANRGVA
jgi:DNA polymerase III subunit delta'